MYRGTPTLTLVVFALTAAPLGGADNVKDFFFHKGDRIVFLGDSITELWTL
jgi:hypothetical protein